MTRNLISFIALLVLTGTAATVEADLRLDRQRSLRVLNGDGEVIFTREFSDALFIGGQSARHDMGSESFVVRAKESVFLWLGHDSETYAELSLPLSLEDLLTDAEKRCIKSFPPSVFTDAEASVIRTAERRSVGGWKSQRLRIEGRLGDDMQFEGERWVTHDLPVDLEPYLLLVRNRAALSPRTRGWIGQLIAEGGYPVETTTIWQGRARRRVFESQLSDVREVDFDETRYRVPAGYSRVSRPPLDVECSGAEAVP